MQEFDSLLELLLMLVKQPRTGILLFLLVLASFSDYVTYKIPNWLTFGGMLFALTYNAAVPFSSTPNHAFLWAAGGLLIGLGTMLPLYAMKIMGAGDVKLMAMIGAFLGISDTLYVILFSFVIGSLAALGFSIANQAITKMLTNMTNINQMFVLTTNLEEEQSIGKLPYGICISLGCGTYLVTKQLGYL